MSTAGKVLVVLAALVMVACIILSSMVGQLNSNWGRNVAALHKERDEFPAKEAEAEARLDQVYLGIQAIQDDKIHRTRVLRTQVEDADGLRTRTVEVLEATKIRRDKADATAKSAEADRDLRIKEKAAAEQALAAQRTEVEQLQAKNAELLARLNQLRDEFKRTLAENQQLLRRLAESGPRVRPATLVTP